MNSLEAMYGCGLNFFIKLAYNSLFLYKFAFVFNFYLYLCDLFLTLSIKQPLLYSQEKGNSPSSTMEMSINGNIVRLIAVNCLY